MPSPTFTSGDDVYKVTTTGTYDLDLLGGNDRLTLNAAAATTTADMGSGDDYVRHNAGTATVAGGIGRDRFDVYGSGLTGNGGDGDDMFNVRAGAGTRLNGGTGSDHFTFYADGSTVTIHGGDGADVFTANSRVVGGTIYGDAGADYFNGFGPGVTLAGGLDNDHYRIFPGSTPVIVENAGEGTDRVDIARGFSYTLPDNVENLTVLGLNGSSDVAAALTGNAGNNVITGSSNVETLRGYAGDDRLYGKDGNDKLYGGADNDMLNGGSGIDTLNGNAGKDTLQGGTGDDIMAGGTENDTYWVDSQNDQVIENAGEGIDTIKLTGAFFLLPDNVENAYQIGGVAGQVYELDGNGLDNVLIGGNGSNTLNGGMGNDTLRGGDGDDALSGYYGTDVLVGGAGDDFLWGSHDADQLTGGEGSDQFTYFYADDSSPGSSDQIHDFDPDGNGTGDKLNFINFDGNDNMAGTQALEWSNQTPTAHSLWYSMTDNGDGTAEVIYYADVTGDTTADFELHVHQLGDAVVGKDILLPV